MSARAVEGGPPEESFSVEDICEMWKANVSSVAEDHGVDTSQMPMISSSCMMAGLRALAAIENRGEVCHFPRVIRAASVAQQWGIADRHRMIRLYLDTTELISP